MKIQKCTVFKRLFFNDSLLSKMIISYLGIIIITLLIITVFISVRFSEILKDKEVSFQDQILGRIVEYTDESIDSAKEIVQRIYLSNKDTKTGIFNFLESDGGEVSFDYYHEKDKFDVLFSTPLIKDNNVLDVIVYKNKTGEIFSYTRNMRKIQSDFQFSQYSWFENTLTGEEILKVIPAYVPTYVQNDKRQVFSAVASIFSSSNKTTGLIIINLDANRIADAYRSYQKDIMGFFLVMNRAGEVLFDSSNRYYGGRYPYFDRLNQAGEYVGLDQESLVTLNYSSKNDLIVAGIIPKTEVLESINSITRIIYFIILLCAVFSFALVFLASSFFSHKVKLITHAMREVERGNLRTRIKLGRNSDELQQISSSFNRMCDQLQNYINKVYVSEIRTKEAELTALQTQINPHFLYNTLESIRMKAIISRNHDVSEMIYALANLFRTSIKSRDKLVKISDEVEYCKSYLELHKIRYRERLTIRFEVEEAIENFYMPKLVLQPVIENCILYGGLDSETEVLNIRVTGKRQRGDIMFQVIDNGRGMSPEVLASLRDSLSEGRAGSDTGSIGLRNINDRIRLLFGEGYGLDIASVCGIGTEVTLRMPIKAQEEGAAHVQSSGC